MNYKLVVCIGLFFFISCKENVQTIAPQKADETGAKNIQLTRDLIATMNQHDWKKMASFYVDSPMMMTAPSGGEFKKSSHNAIIKQHTALEKSIQGLRFDITNIIADSNRVAYEFTASGEMNGKKILFPLSCFIAIDNGKITRDATYFDE